MARIYILASLCLVALGATLGWVLKPERGVPASVQAEVKQTQVKTVTRTVVKTVKPDGTVVVRETDTNRTQSQKTDRSVSPPKTEYRVGVQTGLDLKLTATAGRRLFGNLWLDSAFKPSTKDVTIGLSYEF